MARKKKFPEPVPPLVRVGEGPPPPKLSDLTKAKLVVLSVTAAKNWEN